MYKRDCVALQSHAQSHAKGLLDVVAFTLCTIQMPLVRCLSQMEEVRQSGEDAAALWGVKRKGYSFAKNNIVSLHDAMSNALADNDEVSAMQTMLQVPGLGLVKAGFVCQMFGFDVACIDTHNLKALKLERDAVRYDAKLKEPARIAKIKDYVKLCRDSGGAEYWWDEWCHYVAAKGGMNKMLDSGDAVSAYHVKCVIG